LRAQDAKFAADSLKYSRDFYLKVHFVAIANLSLGSAGTAEFKYDRYPEGGPERIQCQSGEFARTDGKTWLKSNDWGESGQPADAVTSGRLNNWVGLIDGRLNTQDTLKFVTKTDQRERDEVIFEEVKKGPGQSPRYTFGKFKKEESDHPPLLSEFSGPMRLGSHDATVKIQFSYLVSVNIQKTATESPSPASLATAANSKPAANAPAQSRSSESAAELNDRGIEKGKKGDLNGAIADFNRAIELDPKDDGAYYNRAQAKWLKKDSAGAITDYNRAIDLGSTNPAAYNNRGNARAKNKDLDGAIADYTKAIELKPDYAGAYYNRAVAKKDKGDATGAEADLKTAEKLDPELAGEDWAADPKNNSSSAATPVSLLDGKLTLNLPSDFSRDSDDPKDPKTIAKFSGPDGAWGEVLRGTHGLTPDKLEGYLKMRVGEYNKGFKWLPKDSHLEWLKKEIVTIDGRKWADWRFVPMKKGSKDYLRNPVYTRFLTTSYKGQLLEINFTSNLNTKPELKQEIDHIMDSVHLEE
jgi:tetratricopeptide (TPR) repeat protein